MSMDNLSVLILVTLFMLSGSGLACATLLIMLFTGFVDLTYITLFTLSTLMTYFICGITGMIVVLFSTLSFLASGAMYWFEMSVSDAKNKLQEFSTDENNKDNKQVTHIEQKLNELNEYKTKGIETFYEKTGLDEENMKEIKKYYTKASEKFDILIEMIYIYALKFRIATADVAGMREIYQWYDQIMKVKKCIESARALHKMSRNMQVPSTPSGIPSTSRSNQSIDPLSSIFGGLGGMDLGNFADMNKKMQQQMNSLSSDQKSQMDQMAKQMFGNMDMGNMMDMLGGMSGTDKSRNIK